MSDSLRPHGLQRTRFPYPSLSPGVYSNSCLLSWWCYPTILSSANSFFSCPQSFPASGSFPMSRFFAWGGQSIRASASVLPMNIQDWFPLGLAGFFPLGVQGTLESLLQHYNSKASILLCSAFFMVQLSDLYTTIGKTTAFTMWTLAGKVTSLLLNTLSRSVIVFLPRSKCLLISWLRSLSAVILEAKKIKSVTVYTFPPFIYLFLYKQTPICGL